MQPYTVTLDFSIDFGSCNVTPGQVPPGIPEEIASEKLAVKCTQDDGAKRWYSAEMVVEAEIGDGLDEALVGSFNHLPNFILIASSVQGADGGTATMGKPASEVHACICYFESMVPFFRLQQQFASNVAFGSLIVFPSQSNQYIAVVFIEAPAEGSLNVLVGDLLAKAFEAKQDVNNFIALKTTVL